MRIDVKTRREKQREEIRADLVSAAHALVKDEGYEGLTIRKLAERAGLATMSVYSYFADKQSILEAMAEDAFVELAKRCEARRTDDALASLRAGLEEYVIFGLDNPNEYRTVFMTPQLHMPKGKTFDDLEAHNPAFLGLLNAVQECIKAGSLSGEPHAIATILWTVAHGAVSLVLTFPLYPFGEPVGYARKVIDLALHGIRDCEIEALDGSQPFCGGKH